MVTFVCPTLSDHWISLMAKPCSGPLVDKYSFKLLSVAEAIVARSPSTKGAAFAIYKSLAKSGVEVGTATVAMAKGERFNIDWSRIKSGRFGNESAASAVTGSKPIIMNKLVF